MSGEAQKRGKVFEQKVARLMRSKGYKVTRDKRSGAGDVNKADISDYGRSSRLSPELKAHKTLAIKQWTRQAKAAAPAGTIPTVIYEDDEQIMAVVPLKDLLDLELEAKQYREQLEELRAPVSTDDDFPTGTIYPAKVKNPSPSRGLAKLGQAVDDVAEAVTRSIQKGATVCRNGHLVDDQGYCLTKGCPYGRYASKVKKAKA